LYILVDNFEGKLCLGSTYPRFNPCDLTNINIPIPKSKDKIKYWVDKISEPYDKINETQNEIYKLENEIQNKIKEVKEVEEVKLGDICKFLPSTKHYTNIGKENGKYRFYNSSLDEKLYVDFYEVDEYSIILGQGGNFNIHIDKKFTASKHVCVIQLKQQDITLLKYLYYAIPILRDNFVKNGSVINWLNKSNISNINISVPKKEKMEQFEVLFEKINKLNDENKNAKKIYDKYINELNNDIYK